jgi:hypothetical protein
MEKKETTLAAPTCTGKKMKRKTMQAIQAQTCTKQKRKRTLLTTQAEKTTPHISSRKGTTLVLSTVKSPHHRK